MPFSLAALPSITSKLRRQEGVLGSHLLGAAPARVAREVNVGRPAAEPRGNAGEVRYSPHLIANNPANCCPEGSVE